MAGKYGIAPDGDRYWNVRDGEGKFTNGTGEAVRAAMKVADLKLPSIQGNYSSTEKKNLRAQRRKVGQKMLDSGWAPEKVKAELSKDPQSWPALKDVKQVNTRSPEPTPSSDKQLTLTDQQKLENAKIMFGSNSPKVKAFEAKLKEDSSVPSPETPKLVSSLTTKDLKLPTIEGDYTALEKKNLRSQRRKLTQKMIDKGWTKGDIEEALGSDPKAWPDAKDVSYKTNFNQAAKASDPEPAPQPKTPTPSPKESLSKAPGGSKKKAESTKSSDSPKNLSDSQLDAKIRDLQNQIETEELERTSEYKLDELRDTLTPLILEKQSRASSNKGVDAGAKAFNAESAKPATDSVMEEVVGKVGLNFIQEAENALSRPSITTDQLQYHFDKVSSMINRLEEPKLLLNSEEAKKRIRELYITYKSIVGERAIPKFLQNNELFRGI